MRKTLGRLTVLFLILLTSAAAWAEGGRVLVLRGTAWIERGEERIRVAQDALVQQGDIIVTGRGSKAQWWLEDDSVYTLGSNSRLQVEEFRLHRRPEQQKTGLGRLALNLLKGGFRTITGFIGSRNRSAYQVRTPVATMGIRGTDYTAILLTQDQAQSMNLSAGLYVRVATGGIELKNDQGRLDVGVNQIGFVPEDGGPPRLVDQGPRVLIEIFFQEDFQFGTEFFQRLDVDIRVEPERPASPS